MGKENLRPHPTFKFPCRLKNEDSFNDMKGGDVAFPSYYRIKCMLFSILHVIEKETELRSTINIYKGKRGPICV